MKKSTFRVSFYLRGNHVNKSGQSGIMIRISLDGEMKQFYSKVDINGDLWDVKGNCAKGNSHAAREVNKQLEDIRYVLQRHYRDLFGKFGRVGVEQLKCAYLGATDDGDMLLRLYDKKIGQKAVLVGHTIGERTLGKYRNAKEVLSGFIKKQYGMDDYPVSSVDYGFISSLDLYYRGTCKYSHNYVIKHLRYLKQVISDAYKNRLICSDPFMDYRLSQEPVGKDYLIEPEIIKLLDWNFETKHLERVRDMFMFCAFTGLAYIDAYSLTRRHIIEDASGSRWIQVNRTKSSVQANIPLLEIPSAILDKYKGLDPEKLLPLDTNQRMNMYLKEISKICNINKKLSTHCFRHTFATLMLTKGISIESVSKMLGHTNITTTQIYAKILNQKVGDEVSRVKASLDGLGDYYRQRKN